MQLVEAEEQALQLASQAVHWLVTVSAYSELPQRSEVTQTPDEVERKRLEQEVQLVLRLSQVRQLPSQARHYVVEM